MRKKYVLSLVLALALTLGAIVPLAASGRNGNEAYDSNKLHCCSHFDLGERIAPERIDLGNGHVIYKIDLMAEAAASEYYAIEALSTPHCFDCRGMPMFLAAHNVFHMIRELPLPRTCIRVTYARIWQCSICWRTESRATDHAGCGTNCPILR